MFKETALEGSSLLCISQEYICLYRGGHSGPSEIILNNMYIVALVAFCMPSAVMCLAYLCARMFL